MKSLPARGMAARVVRPLPLFTVFCIAVVFLLIIVGPVGAAVPKPTVTNVNPNSGYFTGGDSVVITGTNFDTAKYVSFGTTKNATGAMTVDSPTQITVINPPRNPGKVHVTVTNAGGTSATSSNDYFTYLKGTLTEVAISGTPDVGNTLTAIPTFVPPPGPATNKYDWDGDTYCHTGEGKWEIQDTTSNTLLLTSELTGLYIWVSIKPSGNWGGPEVFSECVGPVGTVIAAPTVTFIDPEGGINIQPVGITNLAGTGFYGTPTVKLTKSGYPDITATGVNVVDPTKITCTFDLTGQTPGYRDVVVTNPDAQEATLADGFEVWDIFDHVGVYDQNTGIFYLRNANHAGHANFVFQFGNPIPGDLVPLAGDWDGNGIDTAGLYQKSTGFFYLSDSNGGVMTANEFQFGPAGANNLIPIAGDWTNAGHDGVGLYDKNDGTFTLKNALSAGPADITFTFTPTDSPTDLRPITGDWTNTGHDGVGLYKNSTGWFYLKNALSTGPADMNFQYGNYFPNEDTVPLAGDWTGINIDTISLYQRSAGWFYHHNSNSGGFADNQFMFGPIDTMTPITGRWI